MQSAFLPECLCIKSIASPFPAGQWTLLRLYKGLKKTIQSGVLSECKDGPENFSAVPGRSDSTEKAPESVQGVQIPALIFVRANRGWGLSMLLQGAVLFPALLYNESRNRRR